MFAIDNDYEREFWLYNILSSLLVILFAYCVWGKYLL